MTHIQFTYEEGRGAFDHKLITKTSDGAEIEIGFMGLEAEYVYLNGHEMEVAGDDYKGLFVNFGHGLDLKFMPIASVIQQANAQIEDIAHEQAVDARSWERHVISCQPSL